MKFSSIDNEKNKLMFSFVTLGKSLLTQALLLGLLATVCIPTVATAQTQLGDDIVLEKSERESNASVSLSADGHRIAVGARDNDGNGYRSGHVRVHQWSGTAWEQIGDDIDGEAAEDFSGEQISLSPDGNRIAIGSARNDGNGDDSGHVRVYQWSGGTWTQLGTDIDGEAAGDSSGGSVSLSHDGNRLAIGAIANDGNGQDSGHVRVYQWSDETWTQLGSDLDGEASGDGFGWSVSISSDGDRLAVGAPFNGEIVAYANQTQAKNNKMPANLIQDSGQTRVYQWSGTDWNQLGSDIDGEAAEDYSGAAVSLSSDGNKLAIGSWFNDGNGEDSGHVRVYRWSGSEWIQQGDDIDGEGAGDESGQAISISSGGKRLAIGAKGDGSGQVRIYHWSGTEWLQIGTDINGQSQDDYFGNHVSLSTDGSRVASAIGNGNAIASDNTLNLVRVYDLSMFNVFNINPGLNDAWYNPLTDGQGFFITVFPNLSAVSLAWFTYDTELPPPDATANLGDAGHRWLTAVGPFDGNQATMEIEMTSGGIFDTAGEVMRTDPPGSDGTIILTFESCSSGTIEYDIPSINRKGIVPIQRVAADNTVLCEALQ